MFVPRHKYEKKRDGGKRKVTGEQSSRYEVVYKTGR